MSEARDIVDAVAHRLPGQKNIYPAINTAIRLLHKRLFFHKASMVSGALSVSIGASVDPGRAGARMCKESPCSFQDANGVTSAAFRTMGRTRPSPKGCYRCR